MTPPDIKNIIIRYLEGDASELDINRLNEYFSQPEPGKELDKAVMDFWNSLQQADARFTRESGATMLNKILEGESRVAANATNVKKLSDARRWLWVAAAFLAVLLLGGYFIFNKDGYKTKHKVPSIAETVVPGKNGALLTLADGTQVLLDTVENKTLDMQGGSAVKVENGILVYEPVGSTAVYNTMSTARGRQFHLTLPDGTHVWLNSISSIKFPTVFDGPERVVELTGEAFFEVAKNVNQPFRVIVDNKVSLKVLGTSFNINAFEDEKEIVTTLIEGSVAVKVEDKGIDVPVMSAENNAYKSGKNYAGVVLRPGYQALINRNAILDLGTAADIQTQPADIEKAIAWKNGLFNFKDAHVSDIMRQLSRWYNIEIEYEKGIPDIYFFGEMQRSMELTDVLASLEITGVRFRLEGRKLIVLPK
ncbi:MAG TPA: FecR domain-containing protein [Parasegetibacter sp.]